MPYLNELETLTGENSVALFQAMPILREEDNRKKLSENILKIQSEKSLIELKERLVRQRIALERKFIFQKDGVHEKHGQDPEALLAAMRQL